MSTLTAIICASFYGSGHASAPMAAKPRFILRDPIDRREQTSVAFGERSHWAQPWRAYLDTVPGIRFRNGIGINFNVDAQHAVQTARLLARAGFRRARVEIGWGEFKFSHPHRLERPNYYRTILRALKQVGIRPLILLNANQGVPVPTRFFTATVVAPVRKGARAVELDPASARQVVPGRTGLNAFPGEPGKAAAILFTSLSRDGTAALSKPVPADMPAGAYPAATLRDAPFQKPRVADGNPNPAFEETLRGWLQYVGDTVRFARSVLGSTRFDVEIWNELSFGSDFLYSDTYYDPPVDAGTGDTIQAIRDRTVAWLRNPLRGLARMGIGDGFASQTPFAAGSTSPRGLTAIDKHPYRDPRRFPKDTIADGEVPLNALRRPDGVREGNGYRDRFTPTYTAFFPEYYLTFIQTESLIRDISPLTTSVYGTPHGRSTHPRRGKPPTVWVTEWNLDPADGGLGPHTGSLTVAQRRVQAKAALRALVSFINKGVRAVYLFAAQDDRLGIIAPSFFRSRSHTQRSAGGTVTAVARLSSHFRGAATIAHPRPLSLASVGDVVGRKQFKGDGTSGHPSLFDRNVVAFFPFQVTDRRYVVAAYVMTRNAARPYPPTPYQLSIGGINTCHVRLTANDPLTGTNVPVTVGSCARNLTVELPLTDSPRLLTIVVP